MPFDSKYGEVMLEHGAHIPDGEQVVVFRATDKNLPELLHSYHVLCKNSRSPQRHLDMITKTYHEVNAYQEEHLDEVHVATSETSRAWLEKGENDGDKESGGA